MRKPHRNEKIGRINFPRQAGTVPEPGGCRVVFAKNFNNNSGFRCYAGKGIPINDSPKSFRLNYKLLVFQNNGNSQTRGKTRKSRLKKTNLTIYLIYLHNRGCGSAWTANKFAALSPPFTLFEKSLLLTPNLKPKSWNKQKCGSCRMS